MTVVLALETSSPSYGVAFGADPSPATHAVISRTDPSFSSVGELVSSLLEGAHAAFSDIEVIGVDAGPGNISSVRSAVAYANALAYSLGVKVFCANSLVLMAAEVQAAEPLPALCITRTGGGNAYIGFFAGGQPPKLRYGKPDDLLPGMVAGSGEICVAGSLRDVAAGLLPGVRISDTGIERPDVLGLYRAARESDAGSGHAGSGQLVTAAVPLHEGSKVFHE